MKCPSCGFITFDYLETCKKCGSPLKAKTRHKAIYEPFLESKKQKERKTIENSLVEEYAHPPVPAQYQREPLFEEPSELVDEEAADFDLARLATRAIAILIDLTILFGITTLTLASGLYFADAKYEISSSNFMDFVITTYLVLLIISSTYFVLLHGLGGRTVGKMAMGIRIIREDGEFIGLREALIRWVGYFISVLCGFLGFIWAVFDSQSQTWHDKLAGTYVVRE